MQVPGSNLLNQALALISAQTFTYFSFVQRNTMPNGMLVNTYATGVVFKGSVQPVSRSLYEHLGLDLQKNYVNVFVPSAVIDIDRDVSSDYIIFGSTTQPGPFYITTDGGIQITTDSGQPIIMDQGSMPQAAKYQAISSTRWYSVDGWTQVLCVQVPSVT